jgi:urease beta subunit
MGDLLVLSSVAHCGIRNILTGSGHHGFCNVLAALGDQGCMAVGKRWSLTEGCSRNFKRGEFRETKRKGLPSQASNEDSRDMEKVNLKADNLLEQ